MIDVEIPGYKDIKIKNVVFDYNGTIAKDGLLIPEVKMKIRELAQKEVNIYIVTADTFHSVEKETSGLPVIIKIFDKDNASLDKKRIIGELGSEVTVSIGNGRNDQEMFKSSLFSIGVIGNEGIYGKTLFEADIVVTSIIDAIDLLLKSNRLKATLRN